MYNEAEREWGHLIFTEPLVVDCRMIRENRSKYTEEMSIRISRSNFLGVKMTIHSNLDGTREILEASKFSDIGRGYLLMQISFY